MGVHPAAMSRFRIGGWATPTSSDVVLQVPASQAPRLLAVLNAAQILDAQVLIHPVPHTLSDVLRREAGEGAENFGLHADGVLQRKVRLDNYRPGQC